MFSLFRRHRGKPVLIADVESGSVGFVVAVVAPGLPARVIVAQRQTLALESRSVEQTANGVVALLTDGAKKMVAAYGASSASKELGPIKTVHAVVGVPWVRARTSRASRSATTRTT